MKTFPDYDLSRELNERDKRLRVEVRAKTACGPVVTGSHVVRLMTLDQKEIKSATMLAASLAVTQLQRGAGAVADACKRRGTHNH